MQAALEIALNLLSPEDREVLRRVYLDDSSVEHAARTLGVSCDVVKARLVRARVRLAEKLSHWRELVSGS